MKPNLKKLLKAIVMADVFHSRSYHYGNTKHVGMAEARWEKIVALAKLIQAGE